MALILYNQGGYGLLPYGSPLDESTGEPDQSFSPPLLDHVALGLSRVLRQYQASPNVLGLLTAMLTLSNELELVLQSLYLLPSVADVGGVNLDIVGVLLGISRQLPEPILLSGVSTSLLPDDEYRLVLNAAVIKNEASSTTEDLLASLALLFGVPVVGVDSYYRVIRVAVGRPLTAVESAILRQLDLLPRPAGVRLDGIVSYNVLSATQPLGYFGFEGQPGALPYHEDGTTSAGRLAEEI